MATPLRRDETQFDNDQELTTADLAQGKRPAPAQEMRPQPVAMSGGQQSGSPESTSLFPANELEDLRTRWKEIQTGFVDEPRKAVEQADGLVASAMKRLAEVFAQERSGLEQQWDRGDNVSTEDLRVALQRYRSFFDRLLSI
ncbi:MAG TPA: hypothetical protein VFA67_13315 [Candidatus Sulfotelmatobacter sp.]|nr:hypothetical protein [Candidatus Sulfotelmatobacter sp.]